MPTTLLSSHLLDAVDFLIDEQDKTGLWRSFTVTGVGGYSAKKSAKTQAFNSGQNLSIQKQSASNLNTSESPSLNTSGKPGKKISAKPHPTGALFPSLLIGQVLTHLKPAKNTDLSPTLQRLSELVHDQASPIFSWNYWLRSATENETTPYPDDLDDTMAALTFWQLHQPELLSPKIQANLVKMLTALEHKTGGPYYTWLAESDDPSWKDLDPVVNANILYLMSLLGVKLPPLTAWLETYLDQPTSASPYYLGLPPLAYFLSRVATQLNPETVHRLTQRLTKHLPADTTQSSPLETALVTTSLIRLGLPESGFNRFQNLAAVARDHLLQTQNANGSWSFEPFVIEHAGSKTKPAKLAGSRALTTAFCLEALWLLEHELDSDHRKKSSRTEKNTLHTSAKPDSVKKKLGSSSGATQLQSLVETTFRQHVTARAPALAPDITTYYQQHFGRSTQTVATLPGLFIASLSSNHQKKLSGFNHKLAEKLGTANILGWIAYTIFDDFLDEEGVITELPLGQVCHRLCLDIFAQITRHHHQDALTQEVHRVLNQVDEANHWEVTTARRKTTSSSAKRTTTITVRLAGSLPDYPGSLFTAHKSIGHGLGPAVTLLLLGFDTNSPAYQAWWQTAKHLLAARQLNDDAHDWLTDLQQGQLNYVTTQILRDHFQNKIPTTLKLTEKTILSLQHTFWTTTLDRVSEDILGHCVAANRVLQAEPVFAHPEPFLKMTHHLRQLNTKAVTERAQAVEFVKAYRE